MTKIIAVTGTPGTGKSTIARKLSLLLHYQYLDGSQLIKSAKIARGYDKKRRTAIVDPALFTREVLKVRAKCAKKGIKGLIVDSHLAHFLPKRAVSCCIVLSCAISALAKRLSKKGFNQPKIRENLDAEIFDTILVEATESGHKIFRFDTTKPAGKALKILANKLKKL
ncbi:adenylate kinase family protein [Candidatus Woesearchaeota archaeon]|nr:adenylate kinase family protein [Candidatus Woesearchaeota archaeon]